jgi:hypothetical protein
VSSPQRHRDTEKGLRMDTGQFAGAASSSSCPQRRPRAQRRPASAALRSSVPLILRFFAGSDDSPLAVPERTPGQQPKVNNPIADRSRLRRTMPRGRCAENRELVDRGATLPEIFEPPMSADERRWNKISLIGVYRRPSAANDVLSLIGSHLCGLCPLRPLSAFSCALFSASPRLSGESYAHCGEMVSS